MFTWLNYVILIIVITFLSSLFLKKELLCATISTFLSLIIFQVPLQMSIAEKLGHVDKFALVAFVTTGSVGFCISFAIAAGFNFLFHRKKNHENDG